MLFTAVIKDNKAFMRCFRKGRYTADKFIVCYYYPNKTAFNGLGISVSKKIGNAVVRNRFKRIVRAAYRECEKDIPIGYDIVFAARQGVLDKSSGDIERFIRSRLIGDMKKNFDKIKK